MLTNPNNVLLNFYYKFDSEYPDCFAETICNYKDVTLAELMEGRTKEIDWENWPAEGYTLGIDLLTDEGRQPIYYEPSFVKSDYPEAVGFILREMKHVSEKEFDDGSVDRYIRQEVENTKDTSYPLEFTAQIKVWRTAVVNLLTNNVEDDWIEHGRCLTVMPNFKASV